MRVWKELDDISNKEKEKENVSEVRKKQRKRNLKQAATSGTSFSESEAENKLGQRHVPLSTID